MEFSMLLSQLKIYCPLYLPIFLLHNQVCYCTIKYADFLLVPGKILGYLIYIIGGVPFERIKPSQSK